MTPFVREGSAPDVVGRTYPGAGDCGEGESVSTDTAAHLMRSGASLLAMAGDGQARLGGRRRAVREGMPGRSVSRKRNEPKTPDDAKHEGTTSIV